MDNFFNGYGDDMDKEIFNMYKYKNTSICTLSCPLTALLVVHNIPIDSVNMQ
jgi:hypothetical protein